jgi:signal peptidase I
MDPENGAPAPAVPEQEPRRRWPRTLLELAVIAVGAIALALLVQAFVVKPFVIPTPSMADTVLIGDRVFVDRISYHFRDVHRGDVVVFTGHGPIPLLKRVVGLPGDRLVIRNDVLYVNGRVADLHTVRRAQGSYEPTQPGPDPGKPWSLQRAYTVPAGRYFVMGDNRTNSDDSRYWGTVRRSEILGKAFFVYWPPSHWRGL